MRRASTALAVLLGLGAMAMGGPTASAVAERQARVALDLPTPTKAPGSGATSTDPAIRQQWQRTRSTRGGRALKRPTGTHKQNRRVAMRKARR